MSDVDLEPSGSGGQDDAVFHWESTGPFGLDDADTPFSHPPNYSLPGVENEKSSTLQFAGDRASEVRALTIRWVEALEKGDIDEAKKLRTFLESVVDTMESFERSLSEGEPLLRQTIWDEDGVEEIAESEDSRKKADPAAAQAATAFVRLNSKHPALMSLVNQDKVGRPWSPAQVTSILRIQARGLDPIEEPSAAPEGRKVSLSDTILVQTDSVEDDQEPAVA